MSYAVYHNYIIFYRVSVRHMPNFEALTILKWKMFYGKERKLRKLRYTQSSRRVCCKIFTNTPHRSYKNKICFICRVYESRRLNFIALAFRQPEIYLKEKAVCAGKLELNVLRLLWSYNPNMPASRTTGYTKRVCNMLCVCVCVAKGKGKSCKSLLLLLHDTLVL